MMDGQTYHALLRRARRQSRRADEAEDLLQSALVAAVEAGRTDMSRPENRRWLGGVLRNRALHDARSAARRHRRDASYHQIRALADTGRDSNPDAPLIALPPALRLTALLALTGHTRAEIVWLLGISDAALRKRISEIRHRWRLAGGGTPQAQMMAKDLPFGLMRRALLPVTRSNHRRFGSHDPDGHLFVLTSQNTVSRQP